MESVRHIEKLLEKYFEATSTVAEEQELQEYFFGEDIAPHLVGYAPMFQYFAQASEERFIKEVPIRTRTVYRLKRWVSVAAAAVLAAGIYFGYQNRIGGTSPRAANNDEHTPEEVQVAYEDTRAAFALIAENFNKGTEKMAYLNEFENAKNKIFINTNN